jgi:hypothetical protein
MLDKVPFDLRPGVHASQAITETSYWVQHDVVQKMINLSVWVLLLRRSDASRLGTTCRGEANWSGTVPGLCL